MYINGANGSQIGDGCTDDNGVFSVPWYSSTSDTQASLVWSAEHCDSRVAIRSGSGNTFVMWTPNKAISNGRPTNWGTMNWGSPNAAHAIANVYDGAERTWRDSLQYANRLLTYFNNVEVRAFSSACSTSCYQESTNRVLLDTAPDTPYVYSPRIAHELGHAASRFASREQRSKVCGDYSFGGSGGWSYDSSEWSCAAFEEGVATWFGDVSRFWYNATSPTTCFSMGGCVPDPDKNIETSSGSSCASGSDRSMINNLRFIWDIYDVANDGETVAEHYSYVTDGLFYFTVGTANRQRDEDEVDLDGRSAFDYRMNYFSNRSVSVFTPWNNNCQLVGD
mgnify:FL=1